MEAHNIKSNPIASGRFLRLECIEYEDRRGKKLTWEAAQRFGTSAAAIIIAHLLPSDRYVLIRQYRPPLGAYTLEVPAGLIDEGESIETTAVRELEEETGYHGTLIWQTGLCSSTSGMTGELVATAFMDVNEELPENAKPVQNLQDNEDIEVLLVSLSEIPELIKTARERGDVIDSRLVAWAAGMGLRW